MGFVGEVVGKCEIFEVGNVGAGEDNVGFIAERVNTVQQVANIVHMTAVVVTLFLGFVQLINQISNVANQEQRKGNETEDELRIGERHYLVTSFLGRYKVLTNIRYR